jgi:hypothetical protein
MNIKAKLIQILPMQTGMGKNGQWRKQDIIVETESQYPKKIAVSIWGDKINENQLILGTSLGIDFDIESKEFNGKWYTELRAWRIENSVTTFASENNLASGSITAEEENEDTDLPF